MKLKEVFYLLGLRPRFEEFGSGGRSGSRIAYIQLG